MLTREEVSKGLLTELDDFEALIRGLDDAQWNAPTRCEGWRVADVAAHVIGTMTEVVEGRADGLGQPGSVERIVDARRGRSATELADELAAARAGAEQMLSVLDDELWQAPAPGDVAPSIGDGVLTLWYDAYVHIEDIRQALGRPPKLGDGLRASVVHLADLLRRDGWGPATVAVDGIDEVEIGTGGPRVSGDPLAFVLAATGRADPAPLGLDETVNIYRAR